MTRLASSMRTEDWFIHNHRRRWKRIHPPAVTHHIVSEQLDLNRIIDNAHHASHYPASGRDPLPAQQ